MLKVCGSGRRGAQRLAHHTFGRPRVRHHRAFQFSQTKCVPELMVVHEQMTVLYVLYTDLTHPRACGRHHPPARQLLRLLLRHLRTQHTSLERASLSFTRYLTLLRLEIITV